VKLIIRLVSAKELVRLGMTVALPTFVVKRLVSLVLRIPSTTVRRRVPIRPVLPIVLIEGFPPLIVPFDLAAAPMRVPLFVAPAIKFVQVVLPRVACGSGEMAPIRVAALVVFPIMIAEILLRLVVRLSLARPLICIPIPRALSMIAVEAAPPPILRCRSGRAPRCAVVLVVFPIVLVEVLLVLVALLPLARPLVSISIPVSGALRIIAMEALPPLIVQLRLEATPICAARPVALPIVPEGVPPLIVRLPLGMAFTRSALRIALFIARSWPPLIV
jgi:hypothetical protein